MKVLVVLEDPTLDQHVVRPLIEWIFEDLGQRARIEVLTDPHLRGGAELLATVDSIIEDNPMIDLFVFVMDHDCDREGNAKKLRSRLERHAVRAIACLAIQEVEVWLLAVQQTVPAAWNEIRAECDPKEKHVEPWLVAQGYTAEDVGRGRKSAMRAAGGYKRILSRCDEVAALKRDIARFVSSA